MLNKHTTTIFAALFLLLSIGANNYNRVSAADEGIEVYRIAHEQKMQKELTCLTRNVYFESASEPYKGKIAVAQVTINRMLSGDYPSTVCGVVHQRTNDICQFSWVCAKGQTVRSQELYAESQQVAHRVLIDGYRIPELKNAMFFHADYVSPNWRKKPKAKIGRHIFY
jgi:spore germination cell wall hydrolase CwlJ-like protein